MRKVFAATVAGLMLAFGLAFTASPATADPIGHYPAAHWSLMDHESPTNFGSAEESAIVGETVKLVRYNPVIGTSAETSNMGLTLKNGDKITVDYTLSGDATTAAGAVRMFAYSQADSDTIKDAPLYVAIADKADGTLTIEAKADGPLGTFGLVYDASNASTGTVTFSNLKVADTKIRFGLIEATPVKPDYTPPTCEKAGVVTKKETPGVDYVVHPEKNGTTKVIAKARHGYDLKDGAKSEWRFKTAKQTGEACQTPTPTPSTTSPAATPSNPGGGGGVSPSATMTTTAAPSTSNVASGGDLPVTGDDSKRRLVIMFSTGVLLFSIGAVMFLVARRRRDADTVESA